MIEIRVLVDVRHAGAFPLPVLDITLEDAEAVNAEILNAQHPRNDDGVLKSFWKIAEVDAGLPCC